MSDPELVAPGAGPGAGRALVPLAEAVRAVLAWVEPLAPARLGLGECLGLVLAEDVAAAEPVPPFASSAMDGYALAATSEPAPLSRRVVRRVLAGDPPGPPISAGEAVRIMTGAAVPPGADAVCMLEESEPAEDGASVVLRHSPLPGEHVRHVGEDVRLGELVLRSGARLSPRHLGVLASVGRAEMLARRRPLVGVLSTGSELRPAPEPLGPGQIRDSNRCMLVGLAAIAGAEVRDLGLVVDDDEAAAAAIASAGEECDLVLTSGGVSVGDRDVVKAVLERCCDGRSRELEVAIRPAKPLAFGVLASGALLVGLPGNPVSSAVSFELFARPVIERLAGAEPGPRTFPGRAGEALSRRPDGKLHLVHVAVSASGDGVLVAVRAGGAASHLLASTLGARALALLPDGDGVAAGSPVELVAITGRGLDGLAPGSVGVPAAEQLESVGEHGQHSVQ